MLSLGIAMTGIKIIYRIKLTSCRGAHTNIRTDHIATLLVGLSVTVEDLGGLKGLYPLLPSQGILYTSIMISTLFY